MASTVYADKEETTIPIFTTWGSSQKSYTDSTKLVGEMQGIWTSQKQFSLHTFFFVSLIPFQQIESLMSSCRVSRGYTQELVTDFLLERRPQSSSFLWALSGDFGIWQDIWPSVDGITTNKNLIFASRLLDSLSTQQEVRCPVISVFANQSYAHSTALHLLLTASYESYLFAYQENIEEKKQLTQMIQEMKMKNANLENSNREKDELLILYENKLQQIHRQLQEALTAKDTWDKRGKKLIETTRHLVSYLLH